MHAEQLVERYLDTWNETDDEARRSAVAAVWSEGAQYVDPLATSAATIRLRADRSGAAAGARPRLPPRRSGVDAHHNVARFSWELVPEAGGESLAIGFDVAVISDDGRIGSVVGFLDKAPGA